MRFAMVIVSLTAIALGLIHLRRAELVARYQIQQIEDRQEQLRRRLQGQQVRLSRLVAPAEVRRRAEERSLGLVEKSQAACAASKGGPVRSSAPKERRR